MVTRTGPDLERKGSLIHEAEGILRDGGWMSERQVSGDNLRDMLVQELLPELRITQELCRAMSGDAHQKDIQNLMRETLRQELPSHLHVFAEDGLRRELTDQLDGVIDAVQRGSRSPRKKKSGKASHLVVNFGMENSPRIEFKDVHDSDMDAPSRNRSKESNHDVGRPNAENSTAAAQQKLLEVANQKMAANQQEGEGNVVSQLVTPRKNSLTAELPGGVDPHGEEEHKAQEEHKTQGGGGGGAPVPSARRHTVFCLDLHVAEDMPGSGNKFDGADSLTSVVPEDEKNIDAAQSTLKTKQSRTYRSRSIRRWARRIVQDARFDTFYGALIMLNAVSMGVQTDVIARSSSEITPVPLQVLDLFFCVVFSTELVMRLLAYGPEFFYMPGWHWSWFDLTLVAMQLFEEIVALIARFNSDNGSQGKGNLSFLRVLRVFRLVRLVRLARILRFVRQLRTLVHSIGESLQSLGWTVLLLVMLIYTVAIYFTQAVSNHRHSLSSDELQAHPVKELEYYFGNLGRSILSLFEATSGGADWDNLAHPLITELSPFVCLIFTFYIAFVILAMLNVVTGVFVENALQGSAIDKETQLVTNLREVFSKFDKDHSGTISLDEFEDMLADPQNIQTFKSFDVNMNQAKSLFSLIDVEGAGCIDINAFIMGCLRLRGTARAADMTTLMYELQRAMVKWRIHMQSLESKIDKLGKHNNVHFGDNSANLGKDDKHDCDNERPLFKGMGCLQGEPVSELQNLVSG